MVTRCAKQNVDVGDRGKQQNFTWTAGARPSPIACTRALRASCDFFAAAGNRIDCESRLGRRTLEVSTVREMPMTPYFTIHYCLTSRHEQYYFRERFSKCSKCLYSRGEHWRMAALGTVHYAVHVCADRLSCPRQLLFLPQTNQCSPGGKLGT